MGGISLITIYDGKFRHNRPEEGFPKMITYISPINMVAEDNHLYFAYKSPLGSVTGIRSSISNGYLICEKFKITNVLLMLLIIYTTIEPESKLYALSWNTALLMFSNTNYIQINTKVRYSRRGCIYDARLSFSMFY